MSAAVRAGGKFSGIHFSLGSQGKIKGDEKEPEIAKLWLFCRLCSNSFIIDQDLFVSVLHTKDQLFLIILYQDHLAW